MTHSHFPHSVNSQFLPQISIVRGHMGELLLVHLIDQSYVGIRHVSSQQISFIIGLLQFSQVHRP